MTPKHTAQAAKILGPKKSLAVEQKVTLESDFAEARALGRKELSRYMVLPHYRNSWLRQGFAEAELADGGSVPLPRSRRMTTHSVPARGAEAAMAASQGASF